MKTDSIYYFYILKCSDGTKYYGHTNNLSEDITYGALKYQGDISYLSELIIDIEDVKDLIRPSNLRSFHSVSSSLIKNGKTRKETIEKLINLFPETKCQGFNSQTPRKFGATTYVPRRYVGVRKLSVH